MPKPLVSSRIAAQADLNERIDMDASLPQILPFPGLVRCRLFGSGSSYGQFAAVVVAESGGMISPGSWIHTVKVASPSFARIL